MDDHTLRILEFDKVLDRLARHASFSAGKDLALALRPSTDHREVAHRQRLTAEARRLRELQPRAGLGGARDVRPQADKAARAAVLLPNELLEVAQTLTAARDLRSNVTRFREELPLLAAIADHTEALPELVSEIERSIDPRGEVTDQASPLLASLRRNVRVAHDRLNDRLQQILRSEKYRDALQEPIVTLRDGRYVIPVKAEQRGHLRGIVHDVSASGATLFVEPLSVVELGNSWRELQLEEEREVERVLRELSGLVGTSADAIIDTVVALSELDLALAKAGLANDLDAPELPHQGEEQPWILEPGGELHLLNARHPLLVLGAVDVVPIDVTAGTTNTALLLTGPNTGGKTVALKTAGLLALMAQAGLPVPADAASTLPVFRSIFADIGDEQSIEQSLSTFSSHMRQIIAIVGSATKESLVLLDELAAGTDPIEGSALARAILGRLLDIGCIVIATTHHGELKEFAHTTDGITNASVEFDPETLRPTYHLTIGLPGRSNALTIAERLGLPHDLIEAARASIAPDQARVESLLSDIQEQRDAAASARAASERARGEAEKAQAMADQRLADVEERLDQMVERTTADLEADAKAVRALLTQAESAVERGRTKRAAERLAKALERQKESETRRPPKRPKPQKKAAAKQHDGPKPEEIQAGDLVWIEGYDRYGEALAAPDDRGEVEVHLGPLRGRVKLAQVERVQRPKHHPSAGPTSSAGPAAPGGGAGATSSGRRDSPGGGAGATSSGRRDSPGGGAGATSFASISPADAPPLEIEVRGQTVDEALPTIDQYLDRAYRASLPWVRIIHGRGTGTLRQQVRDMLSKHPLARSYETGKREEGGEGVTVVHLAE